MSMLTVVTLIFIASIYTANTTLCDRCACDSNSVVCENQEIVQYQMEKCSECVVRTLRFDNCRMGEMNRDNFKDFRNISRLFMSNCDVELDANAFHFLSKLILLDMPGNQLISLQEEMFISNVRLKILNLSRNKISIISADAFNYLRELQKLNLSFNRIIVIEETAFSSLTALEDLDISNNRISKFSASLFPPSSSLKSFRMENNSVTVFGPDFILPFLDSKANITLEPNPLNCECGPLRSAYLVAVRVNPGLNLTCSDGQSWHILRTLNCSETASTPSDITSVESRDVAQDKQDGTEEPPMVFTDNTLISSSRHKSEPPPSVEENTETTSESHIVAPSQSLEDLFTENNTVTVASVFLVCICAILGSLAAAYYVVKNKKLRKRLRSRANNDTQQSTANAAAYTLLSA